MEIEGLGFTVEESKFDYFFSRVSSNSKNQRRSLDNLENLKQLGIDEAADGKESLLEVFAQGLTAPQVGESRSSRYGIIEISYFYPDGDLFVTP